MADFHGLRSLSINGTNVKVAEFATISLSDSMTEGKANQVGGTTFMKKPKIPTIAFTITDHSGLDISSIQNLDNATIEGDFHTEDRAFVLRGASQTGEATLDNEGNIPVQFEGESGQWR